jgi:hypothetical protein
VNIVTAYVEHCASEDIAGEFVNSHDPRLCGKVNIWCPACGKLLEEYIDLPDDGETFEHEFVRLEG